MSSALTYGCLWRNTEPVTPIAQIMRALDRHKQLVCAARVGSHTAVWQLPLLQTVCPDAELHIWGSEASHVPISAPSPDPASILQASWEYAIAAREMLKRTEKSFIVAVGDCGCCCCCSFVLCLLTRTGSVRYTKTGITRSWKSPSYLLLCLSWRKVLTDVSL